MSEKHNKRAKEIVDTILYITIATAGDDNQPWNSPVFSAHDDYYNFYWGSDTESQHSKNIAANNKIFLVIYDSTVAAGAGEGVFIEATASEVKDPTEIVAAHKLLRDRHTVPYWKLEEVQGDNPVRLYKAVPKKIWMNVDGERDGKYVDARVEIQWR